MNAFAEQPPGADAGTRSPSFAVATLGFLSSTFLTAAAMVLLSAL
jgi:hypothetical protein